MIRQFLLGATLAAVSTANALASETPGKAYYLHIVTANGVSACGPFEFYKLTTRHDPLPGTLVAGKLLETACGSGSDIVVAGNLTKSEVVLYDMNPTGDVFQMFTFDLPLQDGGSWAGYICETGYSCNFKGGGTYALGLGFASQEPKHHSPDR